MFLNRIITLATLIGGILAVIVSIPYPNPFLPVIAAFFFTITLLLWKYGYLIIPFFTKAARIVEVRGGYEIPPSRDVILRKSENGYYSTKFMEVRFYESTVDKDNDQKKAIFESFEKAISSLKYIVKISLLISALDLSSHVDEIKTKRSVAETKKSKDGKGNSDDVVRLDREIAHWNRLLERITHGERPVEVISFASTTAFGITRDEAISRVQRQFKELKTILSSAMGCDVVELVDLDMLRCFEWEYFFPTSHEELRDEVF